MALEEQEGVSIEELTEFVNEKITSELQTREIAMDQVNDRMHSIMEEVKTLSHSIETHCEDQEVMKEMNRSMSKKLIAMKLAQQESADAMSSKSADIRLPSKDLILMLISVEKKRGRIVNDSHSISQKVKMNGKKSKKKDKSNAQHRRAKYNQILQENDVKGRTEDGKIQFDKNLPRVAQIDKRGIEQQLQLEHQTKQNLFQRVHLKYSQCRTTVFAPSEYETLHYLAQGCQQAGTKSSSNISNSKEVEILSKFQQEPTNRLELEHVYGYHSQSSLSTSTSGNVFILKSGEYLYSSSALCVMQQPVEYTENARSKSTQRFFTGHTDEVTAMSLHPNGKFVASGQLGRHQSATILVWDSSTLPVSSNSNSNSDSCSTKSVGSSTQNPTSSSILAKMEDQKKSITCLDFSHDGKLLVSLAGDEFNTVNVYACKNSVLLASMRAHSSTVYSIAFNPYQAMGLPDKSGPKPGQALTEDDCCYTLVSCGSRHIRFWTLRRVRIREKTVPSEDASFHGSTFGSPKRAREHKNDISLNMIWKLEGNTPQLEGKGEMQDFTCFTFINDSYPLRVYDYETKKLKVIPGKYDRSLGRVVAGTGQGDLYMFLQPRKAFQSGAEMGNSYHDKNKEKHVHLMRWWETAEHDEEEFLFERFTWEASGYLLSIVPHDVRTGNRFKLSKEVQSEIQELESKLKVKPHMANLRKRLNEIEYKGPLAHSGAVQAICYSNHYHCFFSSGQNGVILTWEPYMYLPPRIPFTSVLYCASPKANTDIFDVHNVKSFVADAEDWFEGEHGILALPWQMLEADEPMNYKYAHMNIHIMSEKSGVKQIQKLKNKQNKSREKLKQLSWNVREFKDVDVPRRSNKAQVEYAKCLQCRYNTKAAESSLVENPLGLSLLVGTCDNELYHMYVKHGSRAVELNGSHCEAIMGLDVHPNLDLFATCSSDWVLRIWSTESCRCELKVCLDGSSLIGPKKVSGMASVVAFHPNNGQEIVIGSTIGDFLVVTVQYNSDSITVQEKFRRSIRSSASPSKTQEKGGKGTKTKQTQSATLDHMHAITEIKYSPNGEFLALGSRDNCVYIFDTVRNYRRATVFFGHSSNVTHIDWSSKSDIIQTNATDGELLYWDVCRQKQITEGLQARDIQWSQWTSVLGWPVQGIWQSQQPTGPLSLSNSCSKSSLIKTCSSVKDLGEISATVSNVAEVGALCKTNGRAIEGQGYESVVVADSNNNIKLFRWPCIQGCAARNYVGHASMIQNVRFTCSDSHIISIGGKDCSIMQWRHINSDGNPVNFKTGDQRSPNTVVRPPKVKKHAMTVEIDPESTTSKKEVYIHSPSRPPESLRNSSSSTSLSTKKGRMRGGGGGGGDDDYDTHQPSKEYYSPVSPRTRKLIKSGEEQPGRDSVNYETHTESNVEESDVERNKSQEYFSDDSRDGKDEGYVQEETPIEDYQSQRQRDSDRALEDEEEYINNSGYHSNEAKERGDESNGSLIEEEVGHENAVGFDRDTLLDDENYESVSNEQRDHDGKSFEEDRDEEYTSKPTFRVEYTTGRESRGGENEEIPEDETHLASYEYEEREQMQNGNEADEYYEEVYEEDLSRRIHSRNSDAPPQEVNDEEIDDEETLGIHSSAIQTANDGSNGEYYGSDQRDEDEDGDGDENEAAVYQKFRVLYDFNADEKDELSIVTDDVLLLLEKVDEDWWRGRVQSTGLEGLFPSNYVEEITVAK